MRERVIIGNTCQVLYVGWSLADKARLGICYAAAGPYFTVYGRLSAGYNKQCHGIGPCGVHGRVRTRPLVSRETHLMAQPTDHSHPLQAAALVLIYAAIIALLYYFCSR
jgi:hypothetical protein